MVDLCRHFDYVYSSYPLEEPDPVLFAKVAEDIRSFRSEKNRSSPPSAKSVGLPLLLHGSLSYDVQRRKHIMRGMWDYPDSTEFGPQRFELVRALASDDAEPILLRDGEFHGSFSLTYFHTTSRGKRKRRSKVVSETAVKIRFTTKKKDEEGPCLSYMVAGMGLNQFGVFRLDGTAEKSATDGDNPPTIYTIALRKHYVPSTLGATGQPAARGGGT